MPKNLHYFTDGKTLKGIDLPQYPDSAWNWITGAPEDTKDEELYSRVAAVYRVANLSAEAIANVPFAVLKGDQEFDTSDDWQNKVGFLPNIRELLRLWRLSLFMTNSAYGFMEGNRAVKNLRYVVPGTITPKIDKWEGLTGFKRRIGEETTEYSLKDNRIFWMWRLDHTTELLPSKNSEFKALMAAAGVLYYADYYVQNFFQRGGIRPALLQVAGVPTREEREKIETVWDKIIHGWSKYLGKVISANEMDVKVIGDGIDNVANGQLHSEKLADVAMAAGMPLSIILANSANYATAQTEYLVWFRDSVVPWANFMEDSLNEKLFKPLGLHFEFRPEMSDKGQEEERQRAGAYRAYVASGMKPSIAAQVVGIDLPPDIEYEELDDVFVPPTPQPVNETEIPIEKEELPEPEDEKSVTLLTIDQLRELEHWQDLAFRKLKQGKSLAFPWVSKTLPEEVASVIRDRLPSCKTLAEIERAFDLNMPDTPDRQLRELADALNKAVEVVVAEGKYSPSQPRVPAGDSDGGQWTDGDRWNAPSGYFDDWFGGEDEKKPAKKPYTSDNLALDLQAFNKWTYQWTGGVDYDAKVSAYKYALGIKELHEYLLKQEYGENIPKTVTVYRVGSVEEGVISFFSKLGPAEGYAERFGETIHEYEVPTEYLVPTMSGAGEVWIDWEYIWE